VTARDIADLAIGTDDDSRFFWEGTARGELLAQRCRGCGALRHPPSPACPHCRSLEWDVEPTPQTGLLHSVAAVRSPGSPIRGEDYLICLVDLADGVRVAANLHGCTLAEARIGASVELFFEPVAHGYQLPQFRLTP
jgi:uncharacterized OB-fold protein